MVEKKVEPKKQVEPRQTNSQGSTTQAEVVGLLASILTEVQKQVLRPPPAPLTGAALTALDLFTGIGAALRLQPLPPIITLIAIPFEVSSPQEVTLTWTSQFAENVVITNSANTAVFPATPVSGGSTSVFVSERTTFTATAVGLCGSATDQATVTFNGIIE